MQNVSFVNGEEIFELFCKVGRSFKPTNPVQLQLISQTSLILMIIIVVNMALAQIPIGTFSHIWVFVCQYGIMFVIIVIIIIIIIYRKVKVSTLKHV